MAGILEGKVILLTGALGGIGLAATRIFLREGARLVLSDIDADRGASFEADLIREGYQVHFLSADVSQEDQVCRLVETATQRFGRLDGAFNNAAIGHKGVPMHELAKEDFQRGLDINLTGVFLCMKHEIRAMLANGSGAIVNTGSVASVVGLPNHAEYVAAKHGILGLTRGAATEYSSRNIRVNALIVGATITPLLQKAIPDAETNTEIAKQLSLLHRLARPEEIGEAAAWLLSDRASFVAGTGLSIDGGFTAA